MTKKFDWTDKKTLQKVIIDSASHSDALKRLGLSVASTNITKLKKYITLYDIDSTHFSSKDKPAKKSKHEETVVDEEPFVVVKSSKYDPLKGIHMELDWNTSFVKILRKNGYTGTTEEDVVSKWFASLSKQVADDMGGDTDYE